MAKGWVSIPFGDNRQVEVESAKDKTRRFKNFDNVIRKTQKLNADDLVKSTANDYLDQQAKDADLILAYEQKRLKSPALIKRAKYLIEKREKLNKKAEAAG